MAHRFENQVRTVVTMTGNVELTAADIAEQTVYNYDPGGSARDLTIPNASEVNAGCMLAIHNAADAAEVITVKSAAQATITTPTQNEATVLFSTGAVWFGIAAADS